MKALLRPRKARPDDRATDPARVEPRPVPRENRLLLLIPDGSLTHWAVALPDVKSAAAYVDRHLLPAQTFLSFWVSDARNGVRPSEQGEALILVRDDKRPEIVRPYSFTDLESARQFLEEEGTGAPDGSGVALYWAEPVSVPRGLTVPPEEAGAMLWQNPVHPAPQTAAAGPAEYRTSVAPGDGSEAAPPASGILTRVAEWPVWDALVPRMADAAQGKQEVYLEALEEDPDARSRTAVIVCLGALAAGVGALGQGPAAAVWYLLFAVGGWWAFVGVIYGTAKVLSGGELPEDGYRRLLATLGLAYSPATLLVLGLFPVFGPLFTLAALIWLGFTGYVAVKTALVMEADHTLLATFAAWIVLFAVSLMGPQLVT